MQGTVSNIHRERGMVAIRTEGHGFTIIEMVSDINIDVGDVYRWSPDTGCGSQTYYNLTKDQQHRVFVQNHWVSPQQLRQQLLYDIT